MEHRHQCDQYTCKHEHVKFCTKCFKPYCEDCGKEWRETEYIYYPNTIWYGRTYPTLSTLLNGSVSSSTVTNLPPDTQVSFTCNHN
jgi:hypothetical protein